MLNYTRLCCMLLWCLCSQVWAQDRMFSHLGVNDGLSQSTVTCIYQDSKGFMWIGTGDGLNMYDGYQFTVFKHSNDDSFSISNNSIRHILEDPIGNLWIATDGGMNKLERSTNRFYRNLPEKDNSIVPICTVEQTIWFWVNGKGFMTYDLKTNKSKALFDTIAYRYISVNSVKQISSKQYLFATNKGLLKFDLNNPTLSLNFEKNHTEYTSCVLKGDPYLWIATQNGIFKYDSTGKRLKSYESMKDVSCMILDKQGNIWVGSSLDGLFIYNRSTDHFDLLPFDPSDKEKSYGSIIIRQFFLDKSGNIWIGNDGTGIDIYSPNKRKFTSYNNTYSFKRGKLSSDFIKCFTEDKQGNIWIGTLKGTDIFDPKKLTVSPSPVTSFVTNVFYRDSENGIWMGGDTSLLIYDTQTKRKQVISTGHKQVVSILQVSPNEWLVGTKEGLYQVHKNNHQYTSERYAQLLSSRVCSFFKDSRNRIWAGTKTGLFYAENGSLFQPYKLTIPGTSDIHGKCFAEDYAGTIWVATNKGLLKIETNGAQRLYTNKNGLPDLLVYSVMIDKNGQLWLSSNKGLSRFNHETELAHNYDISDGIQSYEFNSGAYFKDRNGQLFFGGINGFNMFDPESIKDNPVTPNVELTRLKIFDIDMDTSAAFSELNTLTLPHNENILSFEFAALEFSDISKNKYAYKMEGIDDDWVNAGDRNFARYANMVPGNYVFKVKASNNDGVWGTEKTLLTITLLPPWWRQWWAMTIGLAIIAGIFIMVIRYFSTRKLKQQVVMLEKKQAVNQERTRISKDMHDDLGSGLSKIAIMSSLLKKQLSNEKVAEKHIEKISQTASDLVDNMSHIIWAMNPENDHINDLTAYIRQYALDFLENSSIECEIDFPENMPDLQLSQEERRNIFLVVKESLNNILKHAQATKVIMHISLGKRNMHLHISDNGKGFDMKAIRELGNGLRNMKKRMEQISGMYSVQSSLGNGTVSIITVPIHS